VRNYTTTHSLDDEGNDILGNGKNTDRPGANQKTVLTQDTKMMVSVLNVHHRENRLDQSIQLTSPGCQAAVLWTEPPDDAAKENKIGSNKGCGREDEGHCSVTSFNNGTNKDHFNSLTVR
jgi:hypothetical protein